ncbi:hypothetical protein Rruber_01026 [Rhodococcus ruber]|uniref:hypothetical protein n=1 Tax=Rhodococcus ruber TaxID=1830 RepID=UPI0033662C4E
MGSGLIGRLERLETGIVVMILVALLVESERRDALRWVRLGVGIATVAATFAILASLVADLRPDPTVLHVVAWVSCLAVVLYPRPVAPARTAEPAVAA